MAFPKLLQKLFQNSGAGDKLNTEILPEIPEANIPSSITRNSALDSLSYVKSTNATHMVQEGFTNRATYSLKDFFSKLYANGYREDTVINVVWWYNGGAYITDGQRTINICGGRLYIINLGDHANSSGDVLSTAYYFPCYAWDGPAARITCFTTGSTINTQKIQTFADDAVSIQPGVMVPFAGNSVPSGYLLCNGAAVSRSSYANLYSVIGTTWGAGDGSTTFNLPNASGRVLQGGSYAAYISAGLPNITGTFGSRGMENTYVTATGAFYSASYGGGADGCDYAGVCFGFNAASSNSLYGASSTVQPLAIQTLMIIKV